MRAWRARWESLRQWSRNNCTTCGTVTVGSCAMKSRTRWKIQRTSMTKSVTFVPHWLRPAIKKRQVTSDNSDPKVDARVLRSGGATAGPARLAAISSLLKEGLETEGEASAEVFENTLEEANVTD